MSERSPAPDAPAGLFHALVTHPVAVGMVFLAALVFGLVSYQRLSIELMPDISYPTITVRTTFDGAAPQEVEAQLSRPVEEALATLDGLVRLESRSRPGVSDVMLGFDWGTDMAGASQAIREHLQTTFLPDGADRPLILRYDPSLDPFMRVGLALEADLPSSRRSVGSVGREFSPGDLGFDSASVASRRSNSEHDPVTGLYLLRELADREIKRDLEAMRGLAAVKVRGGLEREIRVELREDWLAARELTPDMVRAALQSENINVAGGSIIEGDVEYLIRTLNEFTTLDELRSLRIRRPDGVQVPLMDVAVLGEGHAEREVIARLDGGEAVELELYKEADANVVEVARRVSDRLFGDGAPKEWGGDPGLAGNLPEGVTLRVLDDQAGFIESAIDNLRDTAVLGGVFAVGVLFLFLRDFRATGIIGLAIPVSVIIGFAPLYLLDVSLNLMSLGGLALGIGMLVDNAVVVLESIQRYREEGQDRVDSAVNGVGDVAAAVTASTLTTVAVFFPIQFVEGVAGQLFGDLSLAVVSSLIASLAVALFLVPMLAALQVDLRLGGSDGAIGLLVRGEAESVGAWARRIGARLKWWCWTEPVAALKASFTGRARWLWLPYLLTRLLLTSLFQLGLTLSLLTFAVLARITVWLGTRLVWPASRLALWAADAFQVVYRLAEGRYRGWLATALDRPVSVLGVVAALAVLSWLALGSLGSELIPSVHQGRFTVELALPVGTPLARTAELVAQAEARVAEHPQVAVVYATIGSDRTADARADEGEHTARLRVELTPGGDLGAREGAVMEDLRQRLAVFPRMTVKMSRPALFSFRTPVEVVLFGFDLDRLRMLGDQVTAELATVPGLRDVKSSLERGHPEIRILYDRQRLHRLGLDAATVAAQVRDKVQGVEATRIHRGDERLSLMVQLVEQDRGTLADLRRINVNPALRPMIPLDAVAEFEEAVGPSEIRRVDQQRAVAISANLEGFDLGSAASDIEATLRSSSLPEGVTWAVAGQSSEMQESLASLQFALALAIFLVYVIMASTFEHLVHPLIILFSVPLAAVGAIGGLWLVGTPLSVVVLIGLIVLAGVVVNNAIVLVDSINRLRAEGLSLDDAIRRAGVLRLRPILITTATTVLGLAPLALGLGAGAEVQGPLAITVIGGLLSSTGLTLVVIPVAYRLLERPAAERAAATAGAEAAG
ncbi:MAG: HAE1 family hydrophobic/amphiphilic exporter-1 [Myxococcota bacterium]